MASASASGTPPLSRRAPTRRELQHDLILAAVIFVGALLSAVLSAIAGLYGEDQAPMQYAIVYAAVLAVPLAVRRRWPEPVAVIVATAYFAAVSLQVPEIYVGNIAMFISFYTVGAWSPHRRRATLVRVGIIIGMFVWLLATMYGEALTHAEDAGVAAAAFSPFLANAMLAILVNALYFGGAYYFGERAWAAASQRDTLVERTAELEREREVTAAQAVALDRVRIARELHDVVAHHVSVMGVQAAAAGAVLPTDQDASARLISGVEASAREAVDELHRLLDTLRTPGAGDDAPASTIGLDSLPALVAASDAAGLPTTFTIIGTPAAVPALTQVNIYRIAQEALTNARRHAGQDAAADVRLRYGADFLELEVVNTGRAIPGTRPGLGQLGMRERAVASGGTIEIGPRDRGGFRVRVTVPLGGVNTEDAAAAPLAREGSTR